jgi:hypothetical protein
MAQGFLESGVSYSDSVCLGSNPSSPATIFPLQYNCLA